MLRRYELTDNEWNRIADLLPAEFTGKQGRPRKNNRVILNELYGLPVVEHPGAIYQNVWPLGNRLQPFPEMD